MGRWTRQELEDQAHHYRLTARKSATTGDWSHWANLFTEDATYVEHHFGRFCGRDAIYKWISAITTPYPMNHMIYFPWTWHVIDEERGWVICELMNRMKDPGDGSLHEEPNITILHYAGDGLWKIRRGRLRLARTWRASSPELAGGQGALREARFAGRDPRDERHIAAIEGVEVKR
jgi:hypothetical protein